MKKKEKKEVKAKMKEVRNIYDNTRISTESQNDSCS